MPNASHVNGVALENIGEVSGVEKGDIDNIYGLGFGTNYRSHTFTGSGNFTVTTGGSFDFLLVGGGGGGGGG